MCGGGEGGIDGIGILSGLFSRLFGLVEVLAGDGVVVAALAISGLDDCQGLTIGLYRLVEPAGKESDLGVSGQRRGVVGALLQMALPVDFQGFDGVVRGILNDCLAFILVLTVRTLLEEQERQIGVGRCQIQVC